MNKELEKLQAEMIEEIDELLKEEYPNIYEDDATTKKLKIDIPNSPFENIDDADFLVPEKEYEAEMEGWTQYFIDAEILMDPKKVKPKMKAKIKSNPKDLSYVDKVIFTPYYNSLSSKERTKLVKKTYEDYWDEIGSKRVNEEYTNALINDKLTGNILDSWDKYIRSNFNKLYKKVFRD